MMPFQTRSMDITERLLTDAGLAPGMRVLDIGCNRGDLTFMAARRVGPGGRVLGVDRSADAIADARSRSAEQRLHHVRFLQSDLDALDLGDETFDAIVCRRVLMYLPDAATTLRRLTRWLHPGGRVIVQEHDATMLPGRLKPLPEHERVISLAWRTVAAEGGDTGIGFKLPAIFAGAGLHLDHIHAEAVVRVAGHEPDAGLHDLTAVARAMLPRMRQQGFAEAEALDLDTLDARLTAELSAAGSPYVGDMAFCAWASKP